MIGDGSEEAIRLSDKRFVGTRLNHTGGSPRISEDAWSEYVGVGKPRIDPSESGPEG